MANVETVEREVEHLRKVLTRIGKQQDDGTGRQDLQRSSTLMT
jgi:hypothetical protein